MANQNLAYEAALQFYVDHGVDEALSDEAVNHLVPVAVAPIVAASMTVAAPSAPTAPMQAPPPPSQDLTAEITTLDELKALLTNFDGLAIKKTATHMIFADGNPEARVMVIGEAPETEDDRKGTPFIGPSGQLLDKILACIDLDRAHEQAASAAYLTNILNWRPPGGRSPTPIEVQTCLPFIERHIALVQPKLLILCGGVAGKALLNSSESISKMRGKIHDYVPQTIKDQSPIPAIVTYHPSHLLQNPAQKKSVWQDILRAQEKLGTL